MFGQRTAIFVREHASLLKLRDTYDLLEPETQSILGQAKDEPASWAKWLRLVVQKTMLPTTVNVYFGANPAPVLSVHKRAALLRTRLEIRDGAGRPLAALQSKLFTIGGSFRIMDPSGQEIGEFKGNWKGWDYSATLQGQAIGIVTKKWAGVLKEVFTNADQYLVQAQRAEHLPLMLGLALAVDLVYKERQS
ncbi:phospholipid scramblase-related protein [Holophaga foetida]|uniref:phospholipid scramblase-related protein n=1 Tax=Holophaga foetida TaxID=35839 RepID=UPI000247334D|nr:phospholipid scramblase-related protein [Holophaga foetida]